MRVSYFGFGVIGTAIYSIWAIVHGSILMSRQGDYKNAANNALNDAKARYEAANSLYLSSEEALTSAEETISNANCYVNQYLAFTIQLIKFCEDSNNPTNPYKILDQKYGIQIFNKPSEQIPTTRQDYDIVYYYTTENQCTANSSGVKTCKDVDVKKSRRDYYTVYGTIYLNYGTVLSGSGSQLYMGCGQYDHGIAISARQWQKSTTGMHLINKYNEQEIRTFASTANVDIKIDNQVRSASNEVATSNTDYNQISTRIVALINQQCNALNSTLKAPSYYSTIATNTIDSLPGLRAEIERTRKIRDQEAAYRDGKKLLYDSADSDYRHELQIWLPVILIPIPVFIILLWCFKEKLENKYFDTQNCCAPSIKVAIPVALYSYPQFRSRDTSRTNITQEPPVANVPDLTDAEAQNVQEVATIVQEPSAPSESEFATVTAPPEQVPSEYDEDLDKGNYYKQSRALQMT